MNDWLLSCLTRSVLLGLVGVLASFALRKRSASLRHAVAVVVLVATLGLPILNLSLPARPVPVLPPAQGPATVHPIPVVVTPAKGSAGTAEAGSSWPAALAWIWLAGAAGLLARTAFGLAGVARRLGSARPVPLDGGAARIVAVDSARVPATLWWGGHVVLLPSQWEEWPPERAESVLRHELAHVERRDWFSQLATRLACALYWPNPLVWWLGRQASDLAEQAADDRVLASGVAPSRYAQDLLAIAQAVSANPLATTLPMARKADLAGRIEMILNDKKKRGSVTLAGLGLALTLTAGISLPLATCVLTGRTNSVHRQASSHPLPEPLRQVILAFAVIDPRTKLLKDMGMDGKLLESGRAGAVTIPAKSLDATTKLIHSDSRILTDPIIRTLGGEKASLECYGAPCGNLHVDVTPDVLKGNSLMLHLVYHIQRPHETKPGTPIEEAMRVHDGETILVAVPTTSGSNALTLCMLRATVLPS